MQRLIEIDEILAKLLAVKVLYKMADTVFSDHPLSGFLARKRG